MANTTPPILPTDAKRIALMLAARGIQDADERVLHQLLDFAHRYTSDILEDAQSYADHANRPGRIETTDVELAVQARSGWEFTEAAPKDYLLPIARKLNRIPLPTLNAAYSHITLPEPHLMLGQPNFRIVPRMPAPESLGLFRLGEEEGSASEEESEGEEEDEEESSKDAGDGPAGMGGEEDGEDDKMETDTVPPTVTAPVEAEPAVNGVKRRLEEDDDYDAD
ncbi:hypothetical protein QFC20_007834 [Naganishia adeliensis]|uniref:Uncharacterized protein n=1 Tax=Naganishia adeliensis TaxID=92952 RepID=A0ACC2UVF1_9TREE|nr:hypothetical protein QFC20_007834 [Naganishia adeliensis]